MTSSEQPKLYGTSYSTYVRTVRLTLAEKDVPYELIPVDVFASGGPSADYLKINPFGRIPSFEHDGFCLYEALPIARYIDETFIGPRLQPLDRHERARMNQIIGVLDSYAYRTLVWDIYVEHRSKDPDEHRVATALPRARTCVKAVDELMGDGTWLAGPGLTLADLHAAPIFEYFMRTTEGSTLLAEYSSLSRWWKEIAQRPSMFATQPKESS